MNFAPKTMVGKLGIRGTLECRNAQGEIIKTIELNGSIPLSTPEQVEQARALISQQEQSHVTDHRDGV